MLEKDSTKDIEGYRIGQFDDEKAQLINQNIENAKNQKLIAGISLDKSCFVFLSFGARDV